LAEEQTGQEEHLAFRQQNIVDRLAFQFEDRGCGRRCRCQRDRPLKPSRENSFQRPGFGRETRRPAQNGAQDRGRQVRHGHADRQ
jgi:hypothetical protein